jgi:hypothetical protein
MAHPKLLDIAFEQLLDECLIPDTNFVREAADSRQQFVWEPD